MLEKLKEHSPRAGARAIILAPTRELALQTHKAVRELAKFTNLRTAVLVGGDAMEAQFAELAQNPDIVVATPGESRCGMARLHVQWNFWWNGLGCRWAITRAGRRKDRGHPGGG